MNYNSLDSISTDTKNKIQNNLIEPLYYDDIKSTIKQRKRWRVAGHVLETFSKIAIAISSILNFYSSYNQSNFEIYAGSVSVLSMACNQLSNYCFNQTRENTHDINQILKSLHIQQIPNIDEDAVQHND